MHAWRKEVTKFETFATPARSAFPATFTLLVSHEHAVLLAAVILPVIEDMVTSLWFFTVNYKSVFHQIEKH